MPVVDWMYRIEYTEVDTDYLSRVYSLPRNSILAMDTGYLLPEYAERFNLSYNYLPHIEEQHEKKLIEQEEYIKFSTNQK